MHGWYCRHHQRCQFVKLFHCKVGQSFEYGCCGSHCSWNISNTNIWVHKLTCPFFNLMWKEKLIGEVIIAIHHLVDARSSSSISSKISPSLEVEVKLSLLEEKTRRHNLTWVQIERMQVWEELSLYSYHESRCLHLKLSFMILDISPKPQHKPL